MERIVDGCERHAYFVLVGFSHEVCGRDVAILLVFEEKFCEEESLAGEPQPSFTDEFGESLP